MKHPTQLVRDMIGHNMAKAGNREPFDHRGHETFQDKGNRDARLKELQSMGHKDLRKTSHGTQLMDPRYVSDSGNFRGPDEGLGNDYRHHFKNIYGIEKKLR